MSGLLEWNCVVKERKFAADVGDYGKSKRLRGSVANQCESAQIRTGILKIKYYSVQDS